MTGTAVANESRRPLPVGWQWVSLGDCCRFENGDAYCQSDWSHSGVPIIRIQNLNDPDKGFNYWAGSLEDRVCVKRGDLLLAWSGTPGTSFGAHIWDRDPGVLNQHIFLVTFSSDALHPGWARDAINQGLQDLIRVAHGAVGLAHVTRRQVDALQIALPPLAEQRRIAGVLREQMAAVERARAAAQARLEAAKALPAAFLRKKFDSPLAKGCVATRLGDILIPHQDVIHPGDRQSGTVQFVGLEHLEPGTGRRVGSMSLDLAHLKGRKPTFRRGQIVYGYLRPYLNKVWIAEFDGCSSVDQFAYDVRSEIADVRYVAWFMRSSTFLRRSTTVTTTGQLPRIGREEIAAVEIALPSLGQQSEIADEIDRWQTDCQNLQDALQAEFSAVGGLSAALLRRAFNGEI